MKYMLQVGLLLFYVFVTTLMSGFQRKAHHCCLYWSGILLVWHVFKISNWPSVSNSQRPMKTGNKQEGKVQSKL